MAVFDGIGAEFGRGLGANARRPDGGTKARGLVARHAGQTFPGGSMDEEVRELGFKPGDLLFEGDRLL